MQWQGRISICTIVWPFFANHICWHLELSCQGVYICAGKKERRRKSSKTIYGLLIHQSKNRKHPGDCRNSRCRNLDLFTPLLSLGRFSEFHGDFCESIEILCPLSSPLTDCVGSSMDSLLMCTLELADDPLLGKFW